MTSAASLQNVDRNHEQFGKRHFFSVNWLTPTCHRRNDVAPGQLHHLAVEDPLRSDRDDLLLVRIRCRLLTAVSLVLHV